MTATPRAWFRREAGVMWFIGVAALLLGGRPAGAQAPGARLVGITLSPAGGTLRAHNSLAMKALGSFDDGTSGVDLTSSVGWSSTDPSVAIVGFNPNAVLWRTSLLTPGCAEGVADARGSCAVATNPGRRLRLPHSVWS